MVNICLSLFIRQPIGILPSKAVVGPYDFNLKCAKCEKVFTQVGSLNRHIRTIHAENPDTSESFLCDTCGRNFTAQLYLDRHIKNHQCGKTFGSTMPLLNHMRFIHRKGGVLCAVCQYKCKDNHSLKIHMAQHVCAGRVLEVKNYTCEHCSNTFSLPAYLARHMINIHCNRCREYECGCGKIFLNKSSLNRHQKGCSVCKSGRKYSCVCGKHFVLKLS